MIFHLESYSCIIVLASMCSANIHQTYSDPYEHHEGYPNNLAERTDDSITQDGQRALYRHHNSSNFKHGVEEPADELHSVANSSDHRDNSQGLHVSPAEPDELARILLSVLHISQLIPMLVSVRGNQYENGMLKHIISKESPLLSTLEEVLSTVQYFLSPDGLESEDRCTADVSAYLQGVEQGQLWALQMLDASGKPGRSILQGATKFLGNYDECLEVTHTLTDERTGQSRVINGGYCHFFLTIPETITNTTTTKRYPIQIDQFHNLIQWDLCLPKSCNDSQVMEAASRLPLNDTGFSLVLAYFTKVTDWKDDPAAVVTVFVMCSIVALSLVGTLYDIISSEIAKNRRARSYVNVDSDSESESFVNDDGLLVNVTDENQISEGSGKRKEKEANEGFGRQLLLSFSIRRNTEKILCTRTGNGDLGCLHGIRVLSMAWVILGHVTSWDGLNSYENVKDYADWTRRFTVQAIDNGSLAVDTFFLLSGCLLTFLFLRECEKSTRGKPTVGQMVIYYIHRWWRLTPLYMSIIMVYAGLLDHLIDGPLAESKTVVDKDHCRENWWANMLYINNLYKTDEMCMQASWFLANDMQFYVVAPLALLPLAYGFAWLGYCVICGFIAVHVISYGYLEWQTGGSSIFVNVTDFVSTIYLAPWCRVGVFAIGMLLGVLLHRTKCKLMTRRYLLALGWLVFQAIGLLCCYVTYDEMQEADRQWDVNTRIAYQTLCRPVWAVYVSWIILVCCTGNGGVVNSILSWSAWIPLGRLTYGAYLIHTVLLSYTDFSVRSLRYADVVFVSYHFIGTFAVSYALSFITCVLVESPCLALEKVVLTRLKLKNRHHNG